MSNLFLKAVNKIPYECLNLPGSKSIANRVLLLAAIANGPSIIHNVPEVAEDVVLMLEALTKLGVSITKLNTPSGDGSSYQIIGCNGQFPVKLAEIFCGNSGTTIRFLGAVLSLMQGSYQLTGVPRMYERPISDLVDALRTVGGQINYLQHPGFPPLEIAAFKDSLIPLIKVSGKVSSQYLTGILLALPLLGREINIQISDQLISKPYIDITLELLKLFGVNVQQVNDVYTITPGVELSGSNYTIEPDASSASYFLAIGAISGSITINNLADNSLQGDRNFARILAQMGAKVEYGADFINVTADKLFAIKVDMQDMPDVAMTLAVVALFAEGVTTITGISSWRVKETDRAAAMDKELTKLGATVTLSEDSITIDPPLRIIPNVAIDTYNDHRMAMCFSLVAVGGIPITINNYECVGKTFANYFEILNQVCYL